MIDASLYQFLTATVSSPWTVEEGKIDADHTIPFVWFRRASTIQERLLNGQPLDNFTSTFDVEVADTDIDACQTMADTIKTAIIGFTPYSTMGTTFVQFADCEDHNDDYVSRSIMDSDVGVHVCAISVSIFHRA